MATPVVFKYGTRAQYDAATKVENALYFLTDTGEIYRGNVNLARGSHYEFVCENNETVEQAFDVIKQAHASANPDAEPLHAVKDDIIVLKTLIAGDKYSYASYVFDGSNWNAMDGNYNADNVYFNEDFTVTSDIGAFLLPEGESNTKLEATGKSLKQLLSTLLAQRILPDATDPAVSVNFSNSTKSLEVGSKITPSYNASLSAGSYTYGPDTGIVATSWTVTDSNGVVRTTASGSFPELTIADNMSYGVTAVATYDAGAIPLDNLGDEAVSKQIPAGSDDGSASTKITGYRNTFYGCYSAKEVEGVQTGSTSDSIRSLPKKSSASWANGKTFDVPITADAQRVVIAYPATLKDLDYVKDANDSDANIISAFTNADGGPKATIKVAGVDGYEPIDYKIFSTDFAGAYGTTNTFKVKIKA